MPVNMERRALLALGLLWLGGVRAVAAAAIDVTGMWSAAVRSRGGLGYQLTFTGTEVAMTFGALIDLKYEIAEDKIKIKTSRPGRSPMSPLIGREFTIDGDTLTIERRRPPQVMTRIGAPHPGAHPIVGDWTYTHQTGVPAIQRFTRKHARSALGAVRHTQGSLPHRGRDDARRVQGPAGSNRADDQARRQCADNARCERQGGPVHQVRVLAHIPEKPALGLDPGGGHRFSEKDMRRLNDFAPAHIRPGLSTPLRIEALLDALGQRGKPGILRLEHVDRGAHGGGRAHQRRLPAAGRHRAPDERGAGVLGRTASMIQSSPPAQS